MSGSNRAQAPEGADFDLDPRPQNDGLLGLGGCSDCNVLGLGPMAGRRMLAQFRWDFFHRATHCVDR